MGQPLSTLTMAGIPKKNLTATHSPSRRGLEESPVFKWILITIALLFSLVFLLLPLVNEIGLLFVYSLISWLSGGTVHGWTSLMAGIALLSGVQLLVLGIIGAYLGRLLEQSRGRPIFVIERIVHGKEN